MNQKIHIVPHDGEWAIRLAGSGKPAAVHSTQQAAIESAMEIAQEEEFDVVVHRRDGSFRNVINYETIERQARESESAHRKALAWGLFAAGALSAVAAYCLLARPGETRRLLRRLDEHRPDWLRAG